MVIPLLTRKICARPTFCCQKPHYKGRDNIQDERINTQYGSSPCVPLQIIPHFSPNSDHMSSVSYQGEEEEITSTWTLFPTQQRTQAERLLFLLVATTLTQM